MMRKRAIRGTCGFLAAAAALGLNAPAMADVKAGVDAWSRGDYAAAVAEWKAPAEAGDPDAMFNMGQAYRLGRGVPQDNARAEYYYSRAAQRGHLQAADVYGLMLFQSGRREAALPYVQDAARRGDPRSQYLLGIAYFNGDIVAKDWVRAYALLTLANGQGLPQAAPAIAEMDRHIPVAQRQQAASLAVRMQQDADAARASEMAAADLAMTDHDGPAAAPPRQAAAVPPPAPPAPAPAPASTRLPQPIQQVPVEPSDTAIADAQEAVRQARLATGTESPAEAGADYARPAEPTRKPPVQASAPQRTQPPAQKPATPPPSQAAASGPWKVQLGAFSVAGNAEKLWSQLGSRPELAGKKRLLVPAGGLTKLLAGGFATQAEAAAACSKLKQAGQACLVTK